MRTQRETDLEDEIKLLHEALSKANKRIAKLEAALPVAHRAALIAARQRPTSKDD